MTSETKPTKSQVDNDTPSLSQTSNHATTLKEDGLNKRNPLEKKLKETTLKHDNYLSALLAVLFTVLIFQAIFVDTIPFFYADFFWDRPLLKLLTTHFSVEFAQLVVDLGHVLALWLLTLGIVVPFYYFRLKVPVKKAKQALQNHDDEVQRERIKTYEGLRLYLQEEVQRLSCVTARVFLDNEKRAKQTRTWLEKTEHILREKDETRLAEAQTLISSVNEMIFREEDELQEQRQWRRFAISIMTFYIVSLAIVIYSTGATASKEMFHAVGVPLSVIVWGALGSLAAILYRFYTEQERIHFDKEVRWLIARPIIGIIMGAMAYLTLVSGLLVLGAGTSHEASAIHWIVAFLAGFSDKFYLRIINLLVERTVGRTSVAKQLLTKDESLDKDKANDKEPPVEEKPKWGIQA